MYLPCRRVDRIPNRYRCHRFWCVVASRHGRILWLPFLSCSLSRSMKLGILLLVTGLLVTNAFGGSDAFDGVKCGSDIPKALTGKGMSNQRVADLEKRHADLGLKDLGGDEISEHLSTTSWLICGSEFMLWRRNHLSGTS